MKYKTICLDFDGVIVQSNNIKNEAFWSIFEAYPQHREAIAKYYDQNETVPRHEKFVSILENIFKVGRDEFLLNGWLNKYQRMTREGIMNCPFVEGAQEFLEDFSSKLPLFLMSATPSDELQWITNQRELKKYFKGVYGAPEKKTSMLSRTLKGEACLTHEMLFIGDSDHDARAAKEVGVPFLGIRGLSQFSNAPFEVFDNLKQVHEHLKEDQT